MNKREYIISSVKNRIKKIDPGVKIILFGSRARNEAKKGSDWDFLILTQYPLTAELKNRFRDELFEAELETDEILTGIIQNKNLWMQYSNTPIFKHILRDGITL